MNQPPATGVVVMRAWIEEGPAPRLRVRITEEADPRSEGARTRVVTTADDACAAIRDWLARIEAESPDPADS